MFCDLRFITKAMQYKKTDKEKNNISIGAKNMKKLYKPKDWPDLIRHLVVTDAKKSVDFYTDAFGFDVVNIVPDNNGIIQHVEMRRGDIGIMLCPEGSMNTTAKSPLSNGVEESVNLYCYCENVDELYTLYTKAIENGAISFMQPEDRPWGDRMCVLIDHDNYKWSFATYLG